MFSRDQWQNMNYDQRVEALQNLEFSEAASQGRPGAVLAGAAMSAGTNGYYDPELNNIYINNDLINAESPDQALETCFHEGRHAYQTHEANLPAVADNPEQAQEWENNFDNYIEYNQDPQGYWNQPVEVDARQYAQERMQEYKQAQDQSAEQDQSQGQDHSQSQYEQPAQRNNEGLAQELNNNTLQLEGQSQDDSRNAERNAEYTI